MAFHHNDDIDSETASIQDVLMCWESSEDDEDDGSIQMTPKITEDLLDPIVYVVPGSPRFASSVFSQGENQALVDLLKKYPNFVPHDMPAVVTKRPRPLCTFINFMGTREPPKPIKKTKAKAKEVKSKAIKSFPYPTEALTSWPRPSKKPKLTPSACAVVTPPLVGKEKMFQASPMPTLAPTTYAVPPSS